MNNYQRGQRRAFTLIELLVVVSIIALLIAILLPSLKRAREQAKQAVCLAGLKGISSGSFTYAADDPNEQAIPFHPMALQTTGATMSDVLRRAIPAYCWGGKSGRGKEDGNQFFWGTGFDKGPATRPLNKLLYKAGFPDYKSNPGTALANWKADEKIDLGMFKCPSDDGYRGLHFDSWKASKLPSFDHYGNSYAGNIMWIFGGSGATDCGGPCCSSNAPFGRPLSRIPNGSNTIYYEENVGRYTFWAALTAGTPYYYDCGSIPYGNVKGWHGRDWIFNVVYVDGHAGPAKVKGCLAPLLNGYPEGNAAEWNCVICRGQGWQRDTLPSPPVPTKLKCSTAAGDID